LWRRGDVQIDLADGEAQAFDPREPFTRTRIKPDRLLVSVFDTRRGAVDQNPSFFGATAFIVTMAFIRDQLSHVELPLLGSRRADPNTHENQCEQIREKLFYSPHLDGPSVRRPASGHIECESGSEARARRDYERREMRDLVESSAAFHRNL